MKADEEAEEVAVTVLSAVRKVFEGNLTAILGWVQQAWRLGCPSTAGPSWR